MATIIPFPPRHPEPDDGSPALGLAICAAIMLPLYAALLWWLL